MENIDLSAIEAKYPRAKFSATIVNERLGLEKRNGAFVKTYVELTAEVDGRGHITAIAAPEGATPQILVSLADAQNNYYIANGIDLTGRMPELQQLLQNAAPGDTIETGGQRFKVLELHGKKVLARAAKKPGEA